ncbi:hypothetical protein FOXG_20604 [Fusarium oxysporum f. sp. lycopersici 4287]|uniref:Uncharacterized protein n=1 Tax=Fusarium oxysporum f. sp. lycopersici (strain 4287 / CBS 123668 / FGSC 9935 / NRRL 34936) TaxID=426428 RepID=A0A0J9WR94_FUSO4|nr:hypothetical protein FOXG_20604 [Fusarium oxysporum f. sp. lycopersici 4287]KNB12137.1 hypothetical protein FOXG_20604 [Fusarium oxysporum f. sp. lycopersici 4287]
MALRPSEQHQKRAARRSTDCAVARANATTL